jgi:hypothetical protein
MTKQLMDWHDYNPELIVMTKQLIEDRHGNKITNLAEDALDARLAAGTSGKIRPAPIPHKGVPL